MRHSIIDFIIAAIVPNGEFDSNEKSLNNRINCKDHIESITSRGAESEREREDEREMTRERERERERESNPDNFNFDIEIPAEGNRTFSAADTSRRVRARVSRDTARSS